MNFIFPLLPNSKSSHPSYSHQTSFHLTCVTILHWIPFHFTSSLLNEFHFTQCWFKIPLQNNSGMKRTDVKRAKCTRHEASWHGGKHFKYRIECGCFHWLFIIFSDLPRKCKSAVRNVSISSWLLYRLAYKISVSSSLVCLLSDHNWCCTRSTKSPWPAIFHVILIIFITWS